MRTSKMTALPMALFPPLFIAEEFGEEGFSEKPTMHANGCAGAAALSFGSRQRTDKTLNMPELLLGFTSNEEMYTSYLLACGTRPLT